MHQSAVFKSNQCEKRNPVQQGFDVGNRDGALDTTFKKNSLMLIVIIVCASIGKNRYRYCIR